MEKWNKYEFQRAPKSATTIDGVFCSCSKINTKKCDDKEMGLNNIPQMKFSLTRNRKWSSFDTKKAAFIPPNICVHRCSVTVFSLHLISKMTAAKLEKKLLEPQEITSHSKIRLTVRWSALLPEPAKASFLMNSLSKQEIKSFPYESSCYLRC